MVSTSFTQVPNIESKANVIKEVGKRARGEAMQNAWARVVLVVVGGRKVRILLTLLPLLHQVDVEINTVKEDSFYYEELWEEPVVVVGEADYKEYQEREKVEEEEWEREVVGISIG